MDDPSVVLRSEASHPTALRGVACKAAPILASCSKSRWGEEVSMGDFRSFRTAVRVPAKPMEPVIDRAGWTAAELRDVNSWNYTITEEDADEILAAVEAVRREGIPVVQVSRDSFPLDAFGDTLADIRRELI